MALYATNRFPGDGSTTSYEFNFVGKYIARDHVKVYREDNATKVRTYVSINDSNFLNDTTLRNLPVTPIGSTLVIYRETPKPPLVGFVNGSRFTEYNMDLVARQGLFVAMEAMDVGDLDARQQLLDAVTVVVGLVNDATTAVSDATAAAAAAATSALNASNSATQAQAAQSGAEAANASAQTAKTDAQTAATNAASSASSASTSASTASTQASNAATSAATAGTSANAANTSANNAATSATNAANSASAANTSAANAAASAATAGNSATAAANSVTAAIASAGNAATSAIDAANSASAAAASAASALVNVASAGPMKCRVVVVNAASRIVRLERCGGQMVALNGVVRTIPAAGIQLTLTSTSTPRHLYLGWDGAQLVLTESTYEPTFDTTFGQWISPGNPNYVAVACVRPDGLATPERFLRNYYNGPAMCHFSQGLAADFTASWDGVERLLTSCQVLLIPGDTISARCCANIMSVPNLRVGDLKLVLDSTLLARARNTHAGDTYLWQNYSCEAHTFNHPVTAAPSQVNFYLNYYPISSGGSNWTALGDGLSTKIVVNITPYKWA